MDCGTRSQQEGASRGALGGHATLDIELEGKVSTAETKSFFEDEPGSMMGQQVLVAL